LQTRKDDVTPTMNPIQASKRSFAKFNLWGSNVPKAEKERSWIQYRQRSNHYIYIYYDHLIDCEILQPLHSKPSFDSLALSHARWYASAPRRLLYMFLLSIVSFEQTPWKWPQTNTASTIPTCILNYNVILHSTLFQKRNVRLQFYVRINMSQVN
jgi:hypothetical protein